MIISSATDFREAARRKLPPFLFHYLDGGAGAEQTLRANVDDLQAVKLRQRVLRGSAELDVSAEWFGERYGLPVALAPVGLAASIVRLVIGTSKTWKPLRLPSSSGLAA